MTKVISQLYILVVLLEAEDQTILDWYTHLTKAEKLEVRLFCKSIIGAVTIWWDALLELYGGNK